MRNLNTPQSIDWDHFWGHQQSSSKLSWSKQRIIKVMEPFVVKGKRVLDAGCGSGFFSEHFLDQGMDTVSLDYSDKALEMTRILTRGKAKLIKQNLVAEDVPLKITERFDIIFSDGLLEHFSLNDQSKILENFRELLSDEGTLITFVPNRWSPWEIIRPIFMPGIDETPFTLRVLKNLHKRNGFNIFQSGGVNTLPFAFSPDKLLGRYFGMLLYTLSKKDVKD